MRAGTHDVNGNEEQPPDLAPVVVTAPRRSSGPPRWLENFLANPRWFDQEPTPRRFRLSLERATLILAAVLFGSGMLTVLAASTGTFRILAPILWFAWAIVLLSFPVAVALRRIRFEGDYGDLVALAAALVMALSAGALHHYYYASQADIGFYVSDATATATTGGRILDGPYDFLLPGFTHTPAGAKASAMFGYSSLAAMFTYAFGMFATPWINGPLAFIGVLAIYRVARQLSGPIGSMFAVALWGTSLLTVWMSRWTMTENAAIPAFWVAVLLGLALWNKWDGLRAALLLGTLVFGALTRPDGIMVLAWFLLVFAIRYRPLVLASIHVLRTDPRYRPHYRRVLIGSAVALLVFIPAAFLVFRALPTEYLVAGFGFAVQVLQFRAVADAPDVPTTGPSPNWGDYALRFEWDSAVQYFLPWMLLVGILGVALRLIPWRRALVIALFCAPFLLFVFMPPVTTAHPWFMRRLWIAFIPFIFILAGTSLDPMRFAWRWPRRVTRRVEDPRPMAAIVPILIAFLFIGLNFQVTLPVAFKREQDSVVPASKVILDFLPPGSTVIVDEEVVEYASVIRFHHDGPVVPWFNNRAQSFFASVRASDEGNGTVIIRIPASNRNFIDIDARGAVKAELHNATVENTVRRDFRNYLSRPPLPQGYTPLAQYLEDDVPSNRWVVGTQPYQLILTAEPTFIQKNIKFDPNHWGRGPLGVHAVGSPSALTINLSKFRADILQSSPLSLHMVYVQNGTEPRNVTAPGRAEPLAVLPSDGSDTLREISIPLPSPMNLTTIHLPKGTILRGILMDLR